VAHEPDEVARQPAGAAVTLATWARLAATACGRAVIDPRGETWDRLAAAWYQRRISDQLDPPACLGARAPLRARWDSHSKITRRAAAQAARARAVDVSGDVGAWDRRLANLPPADVPERVLAAQTADLLAWEAVPMDFCG